MVRIKIFYSTKPLCSQIKCKYMEISYTMAKKWDSVPKRILCFNYLLLLYIKSNILPKILYLRQIFAYRFLAHISNSS